MYKGIGFEIDFIGVQLLSLCIFQYHKADMTPCLFILYIDIINDLFSFIGIYEQGITIQFLYIFRAIKL